MSALRDVVAVLAIVAFAILFVKSFNARS